MAEDAEIDSADLAGLVETLAHLSDRAEDAERIDRIAVLDKIKAAAAAAQASETVAFAASQRAAQEDAGVPSSRLGRGVAEQVALARKVSPTTGSHQVVFAHRLTGDLPNTFRLLARGEISEQAALCVARETAELSVQDRRRLDGDLADDLALMSPRAAAAAVRRQAYALDPESAVRRGKRARKDRGVSIRPAPDTMARLTGFLPCEQGVAAWAALDSRAKTLKAAGDERSLGQIRSDVMVERLTGQRTAEGVSVEVGLVMSADTLFGEDDEPADMAGYGPVPAEMARDLVTHAADSDAERADDRDDASEVRAFVLRMFPDPVDETVAHVDTKRRRFDGALANLIRYRDQTCADPYCDAPIRHLDHKIAYRDGGPTSAANGQGLCERGNYVKDMPGWTHRTDPDDAHRTIVSTPTGHAYATGPPPARGPGSNRQMIAHRRVMRRIEFLRREMLIKNLPAP